MFSWNQRHYQRFCGFCEKSIDSESIVIIQNAKIRHSNLATPIEIDDGTIVNGNNESVTKGSNNNSNHNSNNNSIIQASRLPNPMIFPPISSNNSIHSLNYSFNNNNNNNYNNYNNYNNDNQNNDVTQMIVGSKSPSPAASPYRNAPQTPKDLIEHVQEIPPREQLVGRVSIGSVGSIGSAISIASIASTSANMH